MLASIYINEKGVNPLLGNLDTKDLVEAFGGGIYSVMGSLCIPKFN